MAHAVPIHRLALIRLAPGTRRARDLLCSDERSTFAALCRHTSGREVRRRATARVSPPSLTNRLQRRRNLRVLVPGAGLGRLAWDVANLGIYLPHVPRTRCPLTGHRLRMPGKRVLALHAPCLVLRLEPVCLDVPSHAACDSHARKDRRGQSTHHIPIRPLVLQPAQQHRDAPTNHHPRRHAVLSTPGK